MEKFFGLVVDFRKIDSKFVSHGIDSLLIDNLRLMERKINETLSMADASAKVPGYFR